MQRKILLTRLKTLAPVFGPTRVRASGCQPIRPVWSISPDPFVSFLLGGPSCTPCQSLAVIRPDGACPSLAKRPFSITPGCAMNHGKAPPFGFHGEILVAHVATQGKPGAIFLPNTTHIFDWPPSWVWFKALASPFLPERHVYESILTPSPGLDNVCRMKRNIFFVFLPF